MGPGSPPGSPPGEPGLPHPPPPAADDPALVCLRVSVLSCMPSNQHLNPESVLARGCVCACPCARACSCPPPPLSRRPRAMPTPSSSSGSSPILFQTTTCGG
jgi:hypothetical protein